MEHNAPSTSQRLQSKTTTKQQLPQQRPVGLKSTASITRTGPVVSGRVSKSKSTKKSQATTRSLPEVPGFMPLFPQVMPSKKSTSWKSPRPSITQLIETLNSHRVNTLTELVRIERIAATTPSSSDAQAFQAPMTAAWIYYVTSHQLTTELRTLTPNYPLTSDLVREAYSRVRQDPLSNRSWNLAWMVLTKMKEDGLITAYASAEAMKPEMWGGQAVGPDDVAQLAACFEIEWTTAVDRMLRHWPQPPTWY